MINIVGFNEACVYLACFGNIHERRGYTADRIISELLTKDLIVDVHSKICEVIVLYGTSYKTEIIVFIQNKPFILRFHCGEYYTESFKNTCLVEIKPTIAAPDDALSAIFKKVNKTMDILYLSTKYNDKVQMLISFSIIHPVDLLSV